MFTLVYTYICTHIYIHFYVLHIHIYFKYILFKLFIQIYETHLYYYSYSDCIFIPNIIIRQIINYILYYICTVFYITLDTCMFHIHLTR